MTSPVQPGDVLAGKYRVERVLGVGGMGVVVAATHLQLDQLVALKFMLPEALRNATAVSRFLREARAVVRLKGEHVARVSDVGTLDTGAPYIVMEYLEGEDLNATLEKRGTLPVAEACGYVLQACEAMAEAHVQAIVHRDLKPQNLFLTRRPDGTPFVKVLDFGISKTSLADAQGFEATHTSAMIGSPAYMSPEQIKSAKDVDPRTDIWALGVILHQLVSGRPPFLASTVVELCVQVLHREPAPLAGVPGDFAALVSRCLRKDRDERYANIAELVADLAPFVPRTGAETLERVSRVLNVVPRAPSASTELPTPPMAVRTQESFATTLGGAAGSAITTPPPARRRWLAPAVAIAAVAAVVVIAVGSRGGHGAAAQPAAIDAAVAIAPDAAPPPPVASPPAPADAAIAPVAVDAGAVVAKPPRPPVKRPQVIVEPPPIAKPPPQVDPPPPQVPVEPVKKRDPFETRH